MRSFYFNITIIFFLLLSFTGRGQVVSDTAKLYSAEDQIVLTDSSMFSGNANLKVSKISKAEVKPDPIKALWMGAIIPGYGQILNKKYWKLPIVYGGFLGFAYAITWNSTRYNAYRNGYRDIIDNDDNTNAHLEILPKGYTVDTYGGVSAYTSVLKTGMETFRYNRDLMVLATIGYYGITLVDAFVDAQLSDFDITDDLSMRIKPVLMKSNNGMNNSYGFQFSLCLK